MRYLLFKLFILNVFKINQKIAPLFKISANEGHKDVVEILASNGADNNTEVTDGWTALTCGICYFNYLMFLN